MSFEIHVITKTCLYNFDLLKPHYYIVKLGFTGVYIIFLISAQKHRLWVLVRTASPIYVLSRNMKNISFLSENFQFLEIKFSIYLNRRVLVMLSSQWKIVHAHSLKTVSGKWYWTSPWPFIKCFQSSGKLLDLRLSMPDSYMLQITAPNNTLFNREVLIFFFSNGHTQHVCVAS